MSDRDASRHPREDEFFSSELRRQHGGGGGGRSSGGWGCPPALVGILAAPWLLDLLLSASGRLT